MVINIHNIVNIRLNNEPHYVESFIKDELGYFVNSNLCSVDIDIFFVKKIPDIVSCTSISGSLQFYKDSILIKYGGGRVSFKFSDIDFPKVEVCAEESIDSFCILHLIEKLIMLILPMKGYLMLHASATSDGNNGVSIYTGFQMAGKTKNALSDVEMGREFMGDEFVIVDSNANCYCYPRMVNINKYNTDKYWLILGKKILTGLWNFNLLKYLEVLAKHFIIGKKYKGHIRLNISSIFEQVVIKNTDKVTKLIICSGKDSLCLFNSEDSTSEVINFLYKNNMSEFFNRIEKDLLLSLLDKDIQKTLVAKYVKKSISSHSKILEKFINSVETLTKI